jgi:hypothetical protein
MRLREDSEEPFKIAFPPITAGEIQDKSGGDFLSKTNVICSQSSSESLRSALHAEYKAFHRLIRAPHTCICEAEWIDVTFGGTNRCTKSVSTFLFVERARRILVRLPTSISPFFGHFCSMI